MSEKLPFTNLNDAYDAISANLIAEGFIVEKPIEIQYGLQFNILKSDDSYLIRTYFSKKKGCSLDLSQIKNKSVEETVKKLLLENYSKETKEQEPVSKGKTYCLCVGINEFDDKNISNLSYAKNDAEKLYEKIINKYGKGTGAICLTNEQATKENLIKSLAEINTIIRQEDTFIVLLSTHGEFYKSELLASFFILTKDSQMENLPETALDMNFIKDIISKIKCKKKVLFLDTCYSGGVSKSSSSQKVSDSTKEYIFSNLRSEEYIIITASQPTQFSYEDDEIKHGILSYYLINGLCGAVESKNGTIDVMTLYLYLNTKVKQYAKNKLQKSQEPKFFGAFSGPFSIPLLIDVPEPEKVKEFTSKERKFTFEDVKCIGIDESGKGDFFGPLTVAAVYVKDEKTLENLKKIGVRDSKKIPDSKIISVAKRIEQICDFEVIGIRPPRYNQLYSSMGNLNDILAWGHAQSLEQVLKRNTECSIAISDKFSNSYALISKLKEKGKKIDLIQRPKAEENIAVAAASILARAKFIELMDFMSRAYKHSFNKGTNEEVMQQAIDFIKKGGNINDVAKTHFKTLKEVQKRIKT